MTAGFSVDGAACCPDGEGDKHADACEEEEDAAAHSIDEECAAERDEPAPEGEAAVDFSLCFGAGRFGLEIYEG